MALPTINHPFGVVADPEFGTTPNGKNYCRIRFGSSARKFNQETNQWETTASFYVAGTAWEQDAERIRNAGIKQGDQVYVEGQLVTESWEKDGQKQSKTALRVKAVRRFEKSQNAQQNNGGGFQQQPQQQSAPQQGGGWNAPANDPWSTGGNNGGGWGNPGNDEPPF